MFWFNTPNFIDYYSPRWPRYKQRFEKGTGVSAGKRPQDHESPSSDKQGPAHASSTSPLSWCEPWDEFATNSYVPEVYSPPPGTGSVTPSIASPERGWDFPSLAHPPAGASATDIAQAGLYGQTGEALGNASFTHHESGFASNCLNHIAASDIDDSLHELYAPSLPDGFGGPETLATYRSCEQHTANGSVSLFGISGDSLLSNSPMTTSTLDGYHYPESFSPSQVNHHMGLY